MHFRWSSARTSWMTTKAYQTTPMMTLRRDASAMARFAILAKGKFSARAVREYVVCDSHTLTNDGQSLRFCDRQVAARGTVSK